MKNILFIFALLGLNCFAQNTNFNHSVDDASYGKVVDCKNTYTTPSNEVANLSLADIGYGKAVELIAAFANDQKEYNYVKYIVSPSGDGQVNLEITLSKGDKRTVLKTFSKKLTKSDRKFEFEFEAYFPTQKKMGTVKGTCVLL